MKRLRKERKLSQRALAARAGLSFKGLQLLERPGQDPRLSSLDKLAKALGLPEGAARRAAERLLALPPDSAAAASMAMLLDGPDSWKLHLFNFVDAFRRRPGRELVEAPPDPDLGPKLRALLAGTAETLCAEAGIEPPEWTAGVGPLKRPWFPAGVENLKALALVESPVRFRMRNVFVLANFLDRA